MRNAIMGFMAVCGVIIWCFFVLAVLTLNVTAILCMVYMGIICGFVGYVIITIMEHIGKLD